MKISTTTTPHLPNRAAACAIDSKIDRASKLIANFNERVQEQIDSNIEQLFKIMDDISCESEQARIDSLHERYDSLIEENKRLSKCTAEQQEKFDEVHQYLVKTRAEINKTTQDFFIRLDYIKDIFEIYLFNMSQHVNNTLSEASKEQLEMEILAENEKNQIQMTSAQLQAKIKEETDNKLDQIKLATEGLAKQARESIHKISIDTAKKITELKKIDSEEAEIVKKNHNTSMHEYFKKVEEHHEKLHEDLNKAASKLNGGGSVTSSKPELILDNATGLYYIKAGSFHLEGKGIKDPEFWELFLAASLSTVAIVNGIAAIIATGGAASPAVAIGFSALAGAGLGAGIGGMSYTVRGGLDGSFNLSEFGKTYAIGGATGAVSGALTCGLGLGANALIKEMAEGALKTGLQIGMYTASGALSSGVSNECSNLFQGQELGTGWKSAVIGGALGGFLGGAGSKFVDSIGGGFRAQIGTGMFTGSAGGAGGHLISAAIDGHSVDWSRLIESATTGAIVGGISGYITAKLKFDQQLEKSGKTSMQNYADENGCVVELKNKSTGKIERIEPKGGTTSDKVLRLEGERRLNGTLGHVEPRDGNWEALKDLNGKNIVVSDMQQRGDIRCIERSLLIADHEGIPQGFEQKVSELHQNNKQVALADQRALYHEITREDKFGGEKEKLPNRKIPVRKGDGNGRQTNFTKSDKQAQLDDRHNVTGSRVEANLKGIVYKRAYW